MSNWTEDDLTRAMNSLIVPSEARPGAALPPRPKAIGRIVQPKGMNKTEQQYAQYLELQRLAGDIIWWGFEAIKIRIGERCWLNPDFLVQYADLRIELHDTKAHGRKSESIYHAEDDAIVKARTVGANFPVPIYFLWRDHSGDWQKREM